VSGGGIRELTWREQCPSDG